MKYDTFVSLNQYEESFFLGQALKVVFNDQYNLG